MNKARLLIFEEDNKNATALTQELNAAGFYVAGVASTVKEAHRLASTTRPNWILMGMGQMAEATGLQLARTLQMTRSRSDQTGSALELPSLKVILIGINGGLREVYKDIRVVSPYDTTVLLSGESGTGKECVAQAIHQSSRRSARPLAVVNCAALPLSLAESILFGHEKGSFTGALERRIGKFEHAEGGTIFLDEVGELSLEAQSRLLRVLQEREVERLGSNVPRKVDIRIIAATNRDLRAEVKAGRFRLDLFHRLTVYPIHIPPLRDRMEDLSQLIDHFIDVFSKKCGRPHQYVSCEAMEQLRHHDWPGNIRELEHVLERAVLRTEGDEIRDFSIYNEMPSSSGRFADESLLAISTTIDQVVKAHIVRTLKQ